MTRLFDHDYRIKLNSTLEVYRQKALVIFLIVNALLTLFTSSLPTQLLIVVVILHGLLLTGYIIFLFGIGYWMKKKNCVSLLFYRKKQRYENEIDQNGSNIDDEILKIENILNDNFQCNEYIFTTKYQYDMDTNTTTFSMVVDFLTSENLVKFKMLM